MVNPHGSYQLHATFSFWPTCGSPLPSLDHDGPEARLRSASRILGQSAYESVVTSL